MVPKKIERIVRGLTFPSDSSGHLRYRYCLEVEDNHNFFVQQGILTHNCQGLSDAAWDSLLKIMEEPPPFLTFIFTTTRREKIKASVASRCAPLTMAKVPVREVVAFLTAVCEEEGLIFGEDALRLIAHLTKGNVREAVQKLEDTTLLGDVTVQNVRDLFGLGYVENLVTFWGGLIKGDLAEALAALETWSDDPPGVVERCREFMLYLQCRFLHRGVMTVNPVFDALPPGDMKRLSDAIEERGSFAGLSIEQAYASILKVRIERSPGHCQLNSLRLPF